MSDKKLNLFLLAAILTAIVAALGVLTACAEPLPDLLPALVPPVQTVQVQVTAEVRREPIKKAIEKVWGIVGWSRACPSCPLTPTYGWIDQEASEEPPDLTVAQAAAELSKGGMSEERAKVLGEIIDAPVRAKHLSPGSCGMLGCQTHPGYEVYDDEESQEETDARTVPWGDESGRFRIFRRR